MSFLIGFPSSLHYVIREVTEEQHRSILHFFYSCKAKLKRKPSHCLVSSFASISYE